MKIEALTIFSKMLARENVKIFVSEAETAFVNLATREVHLPNWHFENTHMQRYFAAHECSHVIFTPNDEWMNISNDFDDVNKANHFRSYVNIVDDCRIDRLMTERYPGLRRDYSLGQKALWERDFFQLKATGKNVNEMSFINRINVYFKTYLSTVDAGIVFSDEEQTYIDRIKKIKSFSEAVEIAKELFEKYLDEVESETDEVKSEAAQADIEVPDRLNVHEKQIVEGENEKKLLRIATPGARDPWAMPETLKAFDDSKKDTVQPNVAVSYGSSGNTLSVGRVPLGSVILNKTSTRKSRLIDDVAQYRSYINSFCSMFERRAKAREYERVRTEKTGRIDTNALYSYKYNDEIFKVNEITQVNKNHGFIFLIDCSGSMSSVFKKVLEQVYVLAFICRRLNVPCVAYGFSDSFRGPKRFSGVIGTPATLVTFWDSTKSVEHNKGLMAHAEYDVASNLGGTPLAEALSYMPEVVDQFRVQNPTIDVVNTVVLTDGGDGTGRYHSHIFHEKTHTLYPGGDSPRGATDNTHALFQLLRNAYGVRVTYIDLTNSSHVGSFASTGVGVRNDFGGVDRSIDIRPSKINPQDKSLIKILVDSFA